MTKVVFVTEQEFNSSLLTSKGHWAEEDILEMCDQEIIKGGFRHHVRAGIKRYKATGGGYCAADSGTFRGKRRFDLGTGG